MACCLDDTDCLQYNRKDCEKLQKTRLYPLDAIRGVAACVVAFIWHYQHFAPQNGNPFGNVLGWGYRYGFMAVELFFMLSGFVMMYVYADKISNHQICLKDYMKKRIIHFYPLMLITLIVVALLQLYNEKTIGGWVVYQNNDLFHFVLNLLLMQSAVIDAGSSFNGPSWCISVELFCYLLLYLVLRKSGKDMEKRWVYILGILGGSLFIYYQGLGHPILNALMARGTLCFFIGCVLHYLYRKIVDAKKEVLVGVGCLLFLVGAAFVYYFVSWRSVETAGSVQNCMIYLYGPCIIFIGLFVPGIKHILSIKPLTYLGNISFSIYMWHVPVQFTIMILLRIQGKTWDFSKPVYFLAYVASTLIVAIISYELYEKNMTKLLSGKSKINSNRKRRKKEE